MAGHTKELRVDVGELRSPTVTAQGFLRVDGYVGRPGIYEYVNTEEDEKKGYGKAGTKRRELRPEEEVFRSDVLDGYEGAPMTVLHPKKLVDTKNVRALEVGHASGKAWRADGNRVGVSMIIKDEKAIARVQKRELVELSPGYKMSYTHGGGVDPKYGRYDGVQRDIEVNHLALVPRARGGSDLRVRLDSTDLVVRAETRCDSMWFEADGRTHAIDDRVNDSAAATRSGPAHPRPADRTDAALARRGATTMDPEEQIRSLKAQLAESEKSASERKDALDEAVGRGDRAEARAKTLEDTVSELNIKIAAGATVAETEAIREQAVRADAAELAVSQFEQRFDSAVNERCSIIRRAVAVMGDEFNPDKMSNREIQAVVVKRLDAKADISSASTDATIEGRFDALVELRERTARSLTRASSAITGGMSSATESRVDEREQRRDAWRNQWKQPLPSSSSKTERQKGT